MRQGFVFFRLAHGEIVLDTVSQMALGGGGLGNPALSERVAGTPRDDGEGKMEHCEIGIGALLPPVGDHEARPADEDSAKAVHPAVRSLDHPAPSFAASPSLDLARILPAPRNVPCEAKFVQERIDLAVVIPLVEAHPLWLIARRARARDRDALDSLTREFEVDHVRAGDGEAKGNALRLG